MRGRLLLDLSDVSWYCAGGRPLSGIQRVVLELAARLPAAVEGRGVELVEWDPIGRRLLRCEGLAADWSTEELIGVLSPRRLGAADPARHAGRPWKRARHRLGTWLATGRARLDHRVQTWLGGAQGRAVVEPRAGDRLIQLGVGWNPSASALRSALGDRLRSGEIGLIALVHDASPVDAALPSDASVPREQWMRWFRELIALRAGLLVYSEATRRDLEQLLAAWPGTERPAIQAFELAQEHAIRDRRGGVREPVRALADERYVLCVGPFRGRKNGKMLAAAWQVLRREPGGGSLPRLVFAGPLKPRDFEGAFEAGAIGGEIRLISSPNDEELSLLYRHALFTVFPSRKEGYGLPIAESLWYGRLCLAGGASAMPEVGGPLVDYFDVERVEDLVAKLRVALRPDHRARREESIGRVRLRRWEDSARSLAAAVERLGPSGVALDRSLRAAAAP